MPPSGSDSSLRSRFVVCQNNLADNEIDAHVGMFEPGTNDSYYNLGLETAKVIRDAIAISRAVPTSGEGFVGGG